MQLLTSRGNALLPYANVVRDGSISGGYFADMTVPAMFPVHKSYLTKTYGFCLMRNIFTNHINAITSVHLSIRLFPLYFGND